MLFAGTRHGPEGCLDEGNEDLVSGLRVLNIVRFPNFRSLQLLVASHSWGI